MRFQVVPASYVFLRRGTGGTDRSDSSGGSGGEVLLQLRQGTGYRDGYWAAGAAGHVEADESGFAAAVREAHEELGVTIAPADLEPLTVMHRTGGSHDPVDERVDLFFGCRRWSGEPELRETAKAAALRWVRLDALDTLPGPVVPHEREVLDALAAGTLRPIVTHGFPAGG